MERRPATIRAASKFLPIPPQWELGAKPAKAQAGQVALTNHEVAARLSFSLWGTLPDAELTRAADAGELVKLDAVVGQARRLLADTQRTSETLWDFYAQWLFLKPAPAAVAQITKSAQLFPEFDDALKASMVAETRAFLDQVILTDNGSLTDLATARWSLVDGRVATLYGVTGGGRRRASSR